MGAKMPRHLPEDRGHSTPCWIWQGQKQSGGYGMEYLGGGVRVLAHRLYYERERGPIPEGLQIDHLCRTRACVNPAHLEPVTLAENCRRGSRAKITADIARGIRARHAAGEGTGAIAASVGIDPSTVSNIVAGRRWANA